MTFRKAAVLLLAIALLALASCAKAVPQEAEVTAEPPALGKGINPVLSEDAAGAAENAVYIQEEPEPELEPEEPEEPQDTVYRLSFVGDCTLGTDYDVYGGAGTLVYYVGDDYSYPFTYAREYFENDDFTIINLEGVFTNSLIHKDKIYCFRGPPEYAKILSCSSVECAVLANNHSGDYFEQGLSDTKAALDAEGITYVGDGCSALYETETGLKIGICSYFSGCSGISGTIASLRERGAQIVIATFHFGEEGYYTVTSGQSTWAHLAIDSGADIVFGTHPHVLQKIEQYNGGIIYYSLGNFCFGGNRNPRDKDTAIIVQKVIVTPDGEVSLGETEAVPFRLSSVPEYNDYKPVPYEEGSEEYNRVLEKLDCSPAPAPLSGNE